MAAAPAVVSKPPAPILLVGNSLNRLARGKSWDNVLADLRLAARSPQCLRGEHKPYPIYFEELHCRAHHAGVPETTFHIEVAKQFGQLAATEYHRRLMRLKVAHILTTNYDYSLEESLGARPTKPVIADRWNLDESKFSLFRRTQAGGRWIWHVHGEALVPGSIMLGHDHYVNQAGRLREYWSTGVTYASAGKIVCALRKNPESFESAKTPYTWLDLFVRNPVHICGLTFDFSETVLWFALTRRRMFHLHHKKRQNSQGLAASSAMCNVFFHYFDTRADDAATRARVEVFQSMGVTCVPHRVVKNDYEAAWNKLLAHLEQRLGVAKESGFKKL